MECVYPEKLFFDKIQILVPLGHILSFLGLGFTRKPEVLVCFVMRRCLISLLCVLYFLFCSVCFISYEVSLCVLHFLFSYVCFIFYFSMSSPFSIFLCVLYFIFCYVFSIFCFAMCASFSTTLMDLVLVVSNKMLFDLFSSNDAELIFESRVALLRLCEGV